METRMQRTYLALQIGRFETYAELTETKDGVYKIRFPIIDYRYDVNGSITHKDVKVAIERDKSLIRLSFAGEIDLSCAITTIFGNDWVRASQETLKRQQGLID